MSRKQLLYLGAGIGSTIGGFIPGLWGAGMLSMSSLVLGGVGGLAGIWAMYRLT